MQNKKIAIVGAGNIGTSVACDLLMHGINTTLIDNSPEQLEKSKEEIVRTVRFAPMLNKELQALSQEDVDSKAIFTTELEAVAECNFVIENVPEEWAIKEKVYLEMDRYCKPDTCIGMNTSCTSITQMGSIISRPDKIIGVHFMNPVYLKKTVEIIRGQHTSDQTLNQLNDLLKSLNKESILVNDFPGFVSNRVSHLFMNEAAFVVQDQVATPQKVDAVFKKCFGHAMGPLETADLIGLDTVMKSIDTLYESFGDTKFRCCPLIRQMVYAGHVGRKSGKGFYEYNAN